jgi:hypothetical protein
MDHESTIQTKPSKKPKLTTPDFTASAKDAKKKILCLLHDDSWKHVLGVDMTC